MPRFHRPHYSARLHGAMRALEDRRDSARKAAAALSDQDGYLAASLRGKAAGYHEAVELLLAIEKGYNLPKRLRWTDRRGVAR